MALSRGAPKERQVQPDDDEDGVVRARRRPHRGEGALRVLTGAQAR